MTLRLRLLLVLVGIVAAGLVISDIVTYSSLDSFLVTRLDQQVRALPARQVINLLVECSNSAASVPTTCPASQDGGSAASPLSVPEGTFAQVRETGHTPLSACLQVGSSRQLSAPPKLPSIPASNAQSSAAVVSVGALGCGASSYRAIAINVTFVTIVPSGGFPGFPHQQTTTGVVVLAVPTTDIDQTLGRLLWIEGLVSIIVLVGLGALAWFMVRRGLKPLDEMTATAGAIAAGDLTRRIATDDPATEVGQLGGALNRMLTEIEAAFAARAASEDRLRRFLADASHELRTPLTAVRGYAEMFDRGVSERPDDLATSMRHIRAEANRMSELVDDLLLLARLDQARPLQYEPLDLATVAEEAVDAAHAAYPNRTIALHADAPVRIVGDGGRLRQVVDNLLQNALTHTPEGTPVEVSVGLESAGPAAAADGPVPATALLQVCDKGPGIPVGEQAKIFEPFHRSDSSRARATGGAGLGLAIVSAIAHAHGGSVGVRSPAESSANGAGPGSIFWVRLPAARAVPAQSNGAGPTATMPTTPGATHLTTAE